jgi:hypothetical protein
MAGLVLQDDDRRGRHLLVSQRRDQGARGELHFPLQGAVECGLKHGRAIHKRADLGMDAPIHQSARQVRGTPTGGLGVHGERLSPCSLRVLGGGPALFHHAIENVVPARAKTVWVPARVVERGPLRHGRERGCFRER